MTEPEGSAEGSFFSPFDDIQNSTSVLIPYGSLGQTENLQDHRANVTRTTAGGGGGDFMQNLTLKKKTPTLCWIGDLCVTTHLNIDV